MLIPFSVTEEDIENVHDYFQALSDSDYDADTEDTGDDCL